MDINMIYILYIFVDCVSII